MVNISVREQPSSSVFESCSDELGFEFATDVAASAADIAFMVNNDLEILEVTHCNPVSVTPAETLPPGQPLHWYAPPCEEVPSGQTLHEQ